CCCVVLPRQAAPSSPRSPEAGYCSSADSQAPLLAAGDRRLILGSTAAEADAPTVVAPEALRCLCRRRLAGHGRCWRVAAASSWDDRWDAGGHWVPEHVLVLILVLILALAEATASGSL